MAFGPIMPSSAFPEDGPRVFEAIYTGAGSNETKSEYGLGVEGAVTADSTWSLRFRIPPGLPTGQAKLSLFALATATSGDAKIEVSWASLSAGQDPSSINLDAEATETVTWGAGDDDAYVIHKITLDANVTDPIAASDMLVVNLKFLTASWTLAAESVWQPGLIWE